MRGRTTVVIAHRLSTIKSADRIAVIHNGVIGEEGTYAELSQKEGGLFRRTREIQQAMTADENAGLT